MMMLHLSPATPVSGDTSVQLPVLRAGVTTTGANGRPPRRKIGFGRVRVSDWGYRPFRVY